MAIEPETARCSAPCACIADANYDHGEYGILVRSDLKGHGLGWRLMQTMIEYARWLGLRSIEGEVLQENRTMIEMCRRLGFSVTTNPDDPTLVTVSLLIAAGGDGSTSASRMPGSRPYRHRSQSVDSARRTRKVNSRWIQLSRRA